MTDANAQRAAENGGGVGGSLAQALLAPVAQDFGQGITKNDAKALGLKVKKEQPKARVDMNQVGGNFSAQQAVAAEALEEGVEFEFEGETYVVPPSDEWDIEILEMFESGRQMTAVKMLFGEDQWAKFKSERVPGSKDKRRPKKRTKADITAFSEAMQEALGLQEGE